MLIVLALAWAYVTFGSAPQLGWLLYGIKPVVIAIIAQAVVGLARVALRAAPSLALPVVLLGALVVLYLLGVAPLVLLFGGALLYGLLHALVRFMRERREEDAGGGVTLRSLLVLPVL